MFTCLNLVALYLPQLHWAFFPCHLFFLLPLTEPLLIVTNHLDLHHCLKIRECMKFNEEKNLIRADVQFTCNLISQKAINRFITIIMFPLLASIIFSSIIISIGLLWWNEGTAIITNLNWDWLWAMNHKRITITCRNDTNGQNVVIW